MVFYCNLKVAERATFFMNKFYITTPIFYVNDKPHIGHAFTLVLADVTARYHRSLGEETFLLTGTDEHGAKIARAAERQGEEPQQFTDRVSATFSELAKILNVSNNEFIRTTDQEIHWPGVFKIWEAIKASGDIYESEYEGLYCVGHEAFMKKSDLQDGVCPDHQTKPEKIKEKNYFFKLSKYKKRIKEAYVSGAIMVKPASRANEVLAMLEDSEDVSFSRPRKDLEWGIAVPGDDAQTIYVWADALTNYLSAMGYGRNEDWQKWWPADTHVIGKDILRFHGIIWPAMLLSAGLELPKSLLVHGFITVENQKMSKTIGNVIDPVELVKKYGVDPVRYYLLREIPSTEDGDFSYKKLEDRYNGDLANNLGNLVSRVAKLIETKLEGELNFDGKFFDKEVRQKIEEAEQKYRRAVEEFRLHEALTHIWDLFGFANAHIDSHKPWEADQEGSHLLRTITSIVAIIVSGSRWLEPFLPETVEKISNTFGNNLRAYDVLRLAGQKFIVTKIEPLFPRLK
ncbi:MAG: methionine--tRNA ligase [Candidatus Yanofskybacteria bacterium RIFCSPHIGHO2_01_FULL_44_17]|uniref:Methionine--tRNA ligase n=1 Tax=Candidatus Yanofskybacteria bacterium RIFCSPHIGHO2_01_FULL_44_17 TaxID=1802668 RepID=A0A1F8EUK6_9BACT|nr:MAG: methionine--tRNA ligase [Candidatus Yanofskybacteria bacterium RIFCSPHIGHO2_01_FULL_44_17]